MSKKLKYFLIINVLLCFIGGCSYNFSDRNSTNPKETKSPNEKSNNTSTTTESIEPPVYLEFEEPHKEVSTFEITKIPFATEIPTESQQNEKATEESTIEVSTVANEEINIRYGYCNKKTSVVSVNGDEFDLYEGQQVTILQLGEQLELQWYDTTVRVDAGYISIYPTEYIPDFSKGTWVGSISKN